MSLPPNFSSIPSQTHSLIDVVEQSYGLYIEVVFIKSNEMLIEMLIEMFFFHSVLPTKCDIDNIRHLIIIISKIVDNTCEIKSQHFFKYHSQKFACQKLHAIACTKKILC